jgi:hypothetical protein
VIKQSDKNERPHPLRQLTLEKGVNTPYCTTINKNAPYCLDNRKKIEKNTLKCNYPVLHMKKTIKKDEKHRYPIMQQ